MPGFRIRGARQQSIGFVRKRVRGNLFLQQCLSVVRGCVVLDLLWRGVWTHLHQQVLAEERLNVDLPRHVQQQWHVQKLHLECGRRGAAQRSTKSRWLDQPLFVFGTPQLEPDGLADLRCVDSPFVHQTLDQVQTAPISRQNAMVLGHRSMGTSIADANPQGASTVNFGGNVDLRSSMNERIGDQLTHEQASIFAKVVTTYIGQELEYEFPSCCRALWMSREGNAARTLATPHGADHARIVDRKPSGAAE